MINVGVCPQPPQHVIGPLGTVRSKIPANTSVPLATIVHGVTVVGPAVLLIVVGLAVVLGLAALGAARAAVWQTTLRSAWVWALAAWIAWGICAGLRSYWGDHAPAWLSPCEVGAVALSLCPAVSVLGAKRPQHRAWNFVVASLWGVLVLSSVEFVLLRPGQRLVLGDARGIFLLLLVLVGAVNYIPTRFGLAAVLLAAGQILALAPHGPLRGFSLEAYGSVAGLVLAGAAFGVAWGMTRRRRAAGPLDRVWQDFRDAYGLFWGLRVMERVNATARQLGWNVELRWSGFVDPQSGQPLGQLSPAQQEALRQALRGLLRRFVSHAFLAQRLEGRV